LPGAVPATQFPAQIPINWTAKHAEENLSRNLFQQKFTRIDHLELLASLGADRKCRDKVIHWGVAEQARDLILQIRHASKVSIVRDSVSPCRIHMLEALSPQLLLSKLVLYIKIRSSRRMQEEFQYALMGAAV
jgi:hypothetical protein